MTPAPVHLRALLERLAAKEIRYVLVGGLAVNAWGYLRATRDLDVVPDPSPENLAMLGELLGELKGKVDAGGRLLTADAIGVFLKTGDRTLVATELGRIDILQGLPQIPSFEELDAEATTIDLEGLSVRVCSYEHLIAMKRASERPRDRDDLESLEAARQDLSEEG